MRKGSECVVLTLRPMRQGPCLSGSWPSPELAQRGIHSRWSISVWWMNDSMSLSLWRQSSEPRWKFSHVPYLIYFPHRANKPLGRCSVSSVIGEPQMAITRQNHPTFPTVTTTLETDHTKCLPPCGATGTLTILAGVQNDTNARYCFGKYFSSFFTS